MKIKFVAFSAGLLPAFLFLVSSSLSQQFHTYVVKDLYVVDFPPGYSIGPAPVALGQTVIGSQLWLPPSGDVVELNPAFFSSSAAVSTDGHQQVGYGYTGTNAQHASLWSGSADSAVDVHPSFAGFDQSNASGAGGGRQVGRMFMGQGVSYVEHAVLWSGSAEAAIDLHPAGFKTSVATATNGEQQVGSGLPTGHPSHALLWEGRAASAVDLGPDYSYALGVGGGQQVGYLTLGALGESHAVLWNGTAESMVDLHPDWAKTSTAYATNGESQVGFTTVIVSENPPVLATVATVWSDTTVSPQDLDAYLPDYLHSSIAYTVDAAGNIYGLAYEEDGTAHAIEWLTSAANLANISTRTMAGTGDNVLIAGFIITGTQPKPLLVRGLGSSLADPPYNVPSVLADPVLELHDSTGAIIQTNDNWKDTQQAEIEATGIPPTNDAEAAMVAQLAPGSYTVVLRGAGETVGNGLVEFYDLDTSLDSRLANISSRGLVQTGDEVMIGGFIVGGSDVGDVLVRAIGPSLAQYGVEGVLADPTLELHDFTGALIASNDDWQETQKDEIEATGIAPSDSSESAILATVTGGGYTAIVAGANGTIGVALMEVYKLSSSP